MRRLVDWGCAAAFCALSTIADAAQRPTVAPPSAWVLAAPIPPAREDTKGVAVVPLLVDLQSRLTDDGDEQYVETAIRIGSSQGLSGGTLALVWDPALDNLIIHRYQLIRDGKAIDLLGDGSKITVVRRETNLERATLDGQLTATLQPEDVRVGDVVDLAYTRTHRDPSLDGHSQAVFIIAPGEPVGRMRIRALWPKGKPIHWRAGPGILAPKESRLGDERELVADVQNVTSARPPKGAPQRFQAVNYVTASDFDTWSDVSRAMAPLYAKATALKLGGALTVEAARIAALSNDPKLRALAALTLVQEQIRYLLLAIDDGGYLPADAELTWSRRFGDCKGKTVVLLALLHELGIEARPVLVATRSGDGLAERLPMPGAFDHVLVAATIGRKVYWLDGTRPGDRALDQIRTPDFHWALPITAAGAGLVALLPDPLTRPQSISTLDLEARAGLDAHAKATGEVVLDGDIALGLRFALMQLDPDARRVALKDYWHHEYDFVTADSVTTFDDVATGQLRLSMTGTAKMDWSDYNGRRWYALDGGRVGFRVDTSRDPGPNRDAPFAVEFPNWVERRQTILLPNGGRGFIVDGPDIDRTVAAYTFHRSIKQDGPMVKMVASTRSLASEIPFASIETAKTALPELGERGASLGAPANYKATAADVTELKATTPASADAYLARGEVLLQRSDYTGALADSDAAIALDEKSARAHGLRAVALAWQGDARAEAAAARAAALDPKLVTPWSARSIFAENRGDHAGAEAAITKEIALWPEDIWALTHRAFLRLQRNDTNAALADVDAALKAMPEDTFSRALRGQILFAAGRHAEALADVTAAAEADPTNIRFQVYKATVLAGSSMMTEAAAILDKLVAEHPADLEVLRFRLAYRFRYGPKPGALDDLTTMIRMKPDAEMLVDRAQLWSATDRTHWSADLDSAMPLASNPAQKTMVFKARAVMETRAGAYKAAEAALDAAGRADPTDRQLPILQSHLLILQERYAEAVVLLEASAKRTPVDPVVLNSLCWTKATRNIRPETAVADCDTALRAMPDNAAILDSRGFAKLKLGQVDAAIADYNAALKIRPDLAASLYGRGLAKVRAGQDGADDFAAARKADPKIEMMFTSYGFSAQSGPN